MDPLTPMSGGSWVLLGLAWLSLVVLIVVAGVEATANELGRRRQERGAPEPLPSAAVRLLVHPEQPLAAAFRLVEWLLAAALGGLVTAIALHEGFNVHVWIVTLGAVVFLPLLLGVSRASVGARVERTERELRWFAPPTVALLRPFAAGIALIEQSISRRVFRRGEAVGDREEAAAGAAAHPDEPDEREMAANVLRLQRTAVREVMVPRVDVVAVAETAALPELLAAITGGGHSRLPVYRDSIDQVIGVLYAKDLLPLVGDAAGTVPLAALLRPVFAVPESMRLDELLRELRRRRVHLAVVADEYGGTAGIVTIEDVLEEIVGEIEDEYDAGEPLVERLTEGGLLADGRLSVADLEAALGLSLEHGDFETLAGLVHHHLGRLPEAGDRLDLEGLRIEVVEVEGNRLRQLRLDPLPSPAETDAGDRGRAGGRQRDDGEAGAAPPLPRA